MYTKPDPTLVERFLRNERLSAWVNHLLVALMLACVAVTAVQVVEYLFVDWNGGYLVALSFLVALEALYARRFVQRYPAFGRERLVYRLTEWVVLLLLIKFTLYLVNGFDNLWRDLALWRADFAQYFFTDELLLAVGLLFIIWALAGLFGEDLQNLEGDERILWLERESGIATQRPAARRNLANLIFSLGAAMIFPVALLRLDWTALTGGRPPFQGAVVNIMLYFVLALILLSLTQFSILRAGWSLERIPIGRDMAGRWAASSLLFLAALGLVALLLPTDYSLGLLEVLGYAVSLVMSLLYLLAFLLTLPLILFLSLIGRLLGREYDATPPEIPPLQPPPPSAAGGASWLEWLKSIIFWVVFLGVVGYSLYFYLSQNQELVLRLKKLPLVGAVWRWLRQALGWVKASGEQLRQAAAQRLKRIMAAAPGPPAGSGWSFLNLRRLSARRQVVFYYLALLRRGGERGVERRPADTPSEYAQSLGGAYPDVGGEVEALTEEFLEARYSRREVTPQHAGAARRYWQRIRSALRGGKDVS